MLKLSGTLWLTKNGFYKCSSRAEQSEATWNKSKAWESRLESCLGHTLTSSLSTLASCLSTLASCVSSYKLLTHTYKLSRPHTLTSCVDFDCVFLGCWFLIVCSLVNGFTSVGCLSTPTSCVEFDCVFVACWWICRHRQFISIQSIHYNINQLNSTQINIKSIQPIQFNSINSVQQCLSN